MPQFELVDFEAHSSFRCMRRSANDFKEDHSLHFHPQFELTWIVRSSGLRFVGDSVEDYHANDLVLCGPDLPHCWQNNLLHSEDVAEWFTIQFDGQLLPANLEKMAEFKAIAKMLRNATCGLQFAPVPEHIYTHLLAIEQATGFEKYSLLINLLNTLSRLNARTLATPNFFHDNVVSQTSVNTLNKVHLYLHKHYGQEIQQSDVAELVGMTPSAFSRFYKSATGRTFSSMVKLIRINEAGKMLSGTNLPVTLIANECGYQHSSHFVNHFKEMKGMTPTEYRSLDLGQ